MNERRPNRRADDSTEARSRRHPPEALGAVLWIAGVGDVRLHHADGAAAQTLDYPRKQKEPQRAGVSKDPVRARRNQKPRQKSGPPSITVGELAPQRSAGKLGNRECGDEDADYGSGCAE